MANQWNWQHWQASVQENITCSDALALAKLWPDCTKDKKHHKLETKDIADRINEWSLMRVIDAMLVLNKAGLVLRLRGHVTYIPTLPTENFTKRGDTNVA